MSDQRNPQNAQVSRRLVGNKSSFWASSICSYFFALFVLKCVQFAPSSGHGSEDIWNSGQWSFTFVFKQWSNSDLVVPAVPLSFRSGSSSSGSYGSGGICQSSGTTTAANCPSHQNHGELVQSEVLCSSWSILVVLRQIWFVWQKYRQLFNKATSCDFCEFLNCVISQYSSALVMKVCFPIQSFWHFLLKTFWCFRSNEHEYEWSLGMLSWGKDTIPASGSRIMMSSGAQLGSTVSADFPDPRLTIREHISEGSGVTSWNFPSGSEKKPQLCAKGVFCGVQFHRHTFFASRRWRHLPPGLDALLDIHLPYSSVCSWLVLEEASTKPQEVQDLEQ